MTITYKELDENTIQRTDEDGSLAWIPKDPANADYQRYLNPEAEQSTPSLTDEASAK